jgi:hypothetical protein
MNHFTENEIVDMYALANLYYATCAVENVITTQEHITPPPPWEISTN